MNALLQWLTSPEWALVVKTLLHSLWQAALIAIALALLLRQLGNPDSRYRCALAALAAIPVLLLITWAALNPGSQHQPRASEPQPISSAPVVSASQPSQRPDVQVVVLSRHSPASQSQWIAWLALGWIVGAGVMLGRATIKVAGAERLRRSSKPLDDPQVIRLLAESRRAVGLARQVRVAVTDKLTSPAVIGILMPTLILPLTLVTTLTPEQLRFILLHELAHIRRGDYLANLFQLFAEALLFFNPAAWWVSHQIRREREACCDALAIELSGTPADYARTLVRVAENILEPAPAAATAFGNRGTS
jgi:beta-lactamase regulating signal transducer with metallopeptidase domain